MPPPTTPHDGPATIAELSRTFVDNLRRLEPFGIANPEPLLSIDGAAFSGQLELFGKKVGMFAAPSPIAARAACSHSWPEAAGAEHYQALARPGGRASVCSCGEINRFRGRRIVATRLR